MLKQLAYFMINFFLIENLNTSKFINDSFTYCDVGNLHRFVFKDIDCRQKELPIRTYSNFTNKNIWIMAKNDYVINDFGFQCYKKKVIRYLNESIFFQKSDITFKFNIDLTRIECMAMVDSKKCENKEMICDDNGCYYKKEPVGEYFWAKEKPYSEFECAFHKKLVVGKFGNAPLFSFNKSKCVFSELFCKLADSIIIWYPKMINIYPYTKIHYGKDYKKKDNFIYSLSDQFVFQITKIIELQYDIIYSTTEGLFIYVEDNIKQNSSLIDQIPFNSIQNKSILIQRDINDLMLAENDFKQFLIQNSILDSDRSNLLKNCILFNNQLEILSMFNEKFFTITDLNGNKLIVYSKLNQLFIPDCVNVESIEIRSIDECYSEIPVTIQVSNGNKLNVFLTSNNFLKSFSKKIDCKLVNDRIILPSLRKVLVRVENKIKLNEVNNYNAVYLSFENKNSTILNFFHHEEIIKGYEFLKDFDQINHLNDIDEKFSILPDDHVENSDDFVSKIYAVKNYLYERVEWIQNFIKNIFIFVGILSVCVSIIVGLRYYLKFKSKK